MVTEEQNVTGEDGNVANTEVKQELDVTGENTVIEQVVEAFFDPDEKILQNFYESGKTQITSNDLIVAGFTLTRTASYSFSIGQYRLSRLLLISPYTLEKTN